MKGLKGASVLGLHGPFHLVKGFTIDWMHNCLLNVVKGTLFPLWFEAGNKAKGCYIGVKSKVSMVSLRYAMRKKRSRSINTGLCKARK